VIVRFVDIGGIIEHLENVKSYMS